MNSDEFFARVTAGHTRAAQDLAGIRQRDAAIGHSAAGAIMSQPEADRRALLRLLDEARAEADALRERVKAAMGLIEQRAREAEHAGTGPAYCALWDAVEIVGDALNPKPADAAKEA